LGFIDYAWSVSIQKDNTTLKILQNPLISQPILQNDNFGFTIDLPEVKVMKNGDLSFLDYKFPSNNQGKHKIGRLFRASIMHLTGHTMGPLKKVKFAPKGSNSFTENFFSSLISDCYINSYIKSYFPEKLADLAYANALAYRRIKSTDRIFASSTKLMVALLTKLNVGLVNGSPGLEIEKAINQISNDLLFLKSSFLNSTDLDTESFNKLLTEKTQLFKSIIEPYGPFLEAPSLRHTESIGKCSIYSDLEPSTDFDFENLFLQSLKTLGGDTHIGESSVQFWKPEQDAECIQAFNSDYFEKQRYEKILSKTEPYVKLTRFKGVSIPEEDYTQYLRARSLVQGASRRLLDILRSAFNYLDEDPRQEMGQLDLPAVIQSLASNKPATDVFVLDEYLKPNFAWSLIFDVSSSMQVKGEYGRALAIALAEAAKELMTDPTSWSFYAFSDRLYILKDGSESYSKRVRARIGGLKFDGLTYLPDAVQIAGKMLAKRFEEQRCLIVISDGWPYGYDKMSDVLKESVSNLLRKGVIVIGIGVETSRMKDYFNLHASVYTRKDLVNKFGALYANSSAKALET
jgi:hypothetical protein